MRITVAMFGLALAGAISAGPAYAQKGETAAKGQEIRIVGCVQWEKDYRQARNEGRGGALGTGIGAGNEFVLTFARVEGPGGRTAAASAGTAGTGANGEKKLTTGAAYSITGDREKELGRRIGQQIEVIGILEDSGEANSERAGDLPRIRMTAWVPLKDFCPAQ
jgi:hypothetical protein